MAIEVINKPWTQTTVSAGKFATKQQSVSDVTTADNETNTFVTPEIDSSALLNSNKIMVYLAVVGAGANVVADMFLEMSPDGSNWSNHALTGSDYLEVVNDIQPDVATTKVYMIDLTGYSVPYYRIGINSAGLTMGVGFSIQMGYAFPLS